MAEGVLFDVAGKIIEQLGSLAAHEIGLARSVEDDITQLKDTVRIIQGILLDAEEQHRKKNNEATAWLQTLKDAFYDADDLLDHYYTQFQQRKVMTMAKKVRIFFSESNQIAFSLKMAHRMKKITERLQRIYNARPLYLNVRSVDEKREVNLERETHSFVPKEKVIGRGDEKNDLIKLLLDSNDEENVSVISIYGLGGLGKTTLAQFVYNDENITSYFQLRMWVCVSNEFNVKLIVEKIIKSITHKAPEKLELDQLQECLRKEIEGKRYLLVLDDIWNENPNEWDKLKSLLLNGARGSKILVTTRSEHIAKITSKHSFHIYPLGVLDKIKSWSLFKQIAFEHGIEPKDSMLVQIGKEIVAKSGGVPLAIMTIGRLLKLNYGNNKEDDWLHFKDNEMSKIIQEENDILPILKLSYDHLPSHLKQCFAYCALFPKDYKIEKQNLIRLWSAQGFLQGSNKKECLEDIGDKYFMALLLRSFFQDPEYDEWDNIIACKMHDLMHDLAQLVVGIECTTVALDTIESVDVKCRHISLYCGEKSRSSKFPTALYSAKNIRSLLLFDQSNKRYQMDDGYEILTSYRYLRALDFGGIRFQKLFTSKGKLKSSIAKLEHLRYLKFSNMNIKIFPNSILRLWNLETLDLSSCYFLEELPSGISKMVNLRNLIIKGCDSLLGMPHGLGLLTNLQTLSQFVPSKRNSSDISESKYSGIDELNRLNNLRGELYLPNLDYVEDGTLANLSEKRFLQSLILDWGWRARDEEINEVVLEGLKPHPNLKKITIYSFMGVKFCNWFSSLTNLTSISIRSCGHCRSISLLNRFPHLKILNLQYLSDLEYISEEASNGCSSTLSTTFFPSLKELTLRDCRKLKGWWKRDVDDDGGELPSFPCLSKLHIEACPNLLSMPLYPSLEKLYLSDTSSKPFVQTIMLVNSVGPSTSSNFSTPLSKLKSMLLSTIPDLESLPVEGMQNLTSLVDLSIFSCPRLTQVHQGIRFLTSLQNLLLWGCDEVDFLTDDLQWQSLQSLYDLQLSRLPKLVCLPKGFQYLTSLHKLNIGHCDQFESSSSEDDDDMPWQGFRSLQFLNIYDFPKLVSLPKGLQYVTTLQELYISSCHNLTALPEWISNSSSLSTLYITDCPKLSERCGNNMGIDWPMIAHIPNIRIDYQWIQRDGCYQYSS